MKKIVSLLLSLTMVFSFAYANNQEPYISPFGVADIHLPTGGICTEDAPSYEDNRNIGLNDLGDTLEFEKYFYNAVYNQQSTIEISSYNIPSSGFNDWFLEFAFTYPELFLVDNGFSVTKSNGYISTVSPVYYVDKSNRETFTQVLNTKLEEYYNLVKDEPDDLKKYLLIHSKMTRESHYDYNYSSNMASHTMYSFFVNGASTCQGYANALMVIGKKVGFEVSCCLNRNPEVAHIWNYIKLNDKWYHTDVAWDDYNASIDGNTHTDENDQGTFHIFFLCSEETFTSNGHGKKADYRLFDNAPSSCTDKTYESDEWAFNLNNAGASYLMDFDRDDDNIFFDLVGGKDSNGNPLKFVTNNLYGNDTYVSSPMIETESVKYYLFSKKDISSAKMRLVLKSDDKIKSVVSGDITGKNKFTIYSTYVAPDAESLSQSDEICAHLWSGATPLAEKNIYIVSPETSAK